MVALSQSTYKECALPIETNGDIAFSTVLILAISQAGI